MKAKTRSVLGPAAVGVLAASLTIGLSACGSNAWSLLIEIPVERL